MKTVKKKSVNKLAIELLKVNNTLKTPLNYKEIAEKIRTELGTKTQDKSIAWYASKYKQKILNQELDEIDQDILTDFAINHNNEEKEVNNWELAEEFVVEYEKSNKDVVKVEKVTFTSRQNLKGYDILSTYKDGTTRCIEVKSKKDKKITWLNLTPNETEEFLKNDNYYLYLVEGDLLKTKDISLTIVDNQTLRKMKIDKTIVRFSSLGSCERLKIDKNSLSKK